MSVNGIASFFQNVSDELFTQAKGSLASTNVPGTVNASAAPITEDVFTPSSQADSAQTTARDAGIFQIAQGAGSSNAVNPVAGAANSVSAANAGSTTNAGQGASQSPSAQAAASGAASAYEQQQIQSLNAALPALGLTSIEIDQIDRIASLVHNFNPAAYSSLVNQFETLAQQAAPPSAVNAAVTPGASVAAATATSANGSGFQVQQVLLTFTGAQQNSADNSAATSGTQGTAANNAPPATSGPQIESVQFTLINSKGQTVKVQTQ